MIGNLFTEEPIRRKRSFAMPTRAKRSASSSWNLSGTAPVGLHCAGKTRTGGTVIVYITAAVVMGLVSLYVAWRIRDYRKFLAGAFFVSSGILFYLYLADVSVPLLGTGFVETPKISGGRSIVHFILFLLCFYFGFVKKPRA
jgi:hypothetical protein